MFPASQITAFTNFHVNNKVQEKHFLGESFNEREMKKGIFVTVNHFFKNSMFCGNAKCL